MTTELKRLVKMLSLEPHPEGGFFKETYRSPLRIPEEGLPEAFLGSRRSSTSILYLLPAGAKSRWHRIKSDEIWSFHLGGPIQVCEISTKGKPKCTMVGPATRRGQVLQHVVPAGSWFAAKPAAGTAYSLVGCVVAPGFEYEDFELAERGDLEKKYPKLKKLVAQYF